MAWRGGVWTGFALGQAVHPPPPSPLPPSLSMTSTASLVPAGWLYSVAQRLHWRRERTQSFKLLWRMQLGNTRSQGQQRNKASYFAITIAIKETILCPLVIEPVTAMITFTFTRWPAALVRTSHGKVSVVKNMRRYFFKANESCRNQFCMRQSFP